MRSLWRLLCVTALYAADPQLQVFQRAVAELSAGNYAAAEAGFEQVLKAAPRNVGALGNLGVVYSRTSRPDKAIAVYRRALRIVPQDPALMLNLGLVYVKQESFGDALPLFEKLVALAPANAQARELLATCQLSMGRTATAIRSLEALRESDSNRPGVLYLLGVAYLKNKEPQKAAAALDGAIAAAPPATADFMLGKAYYESARFEEAEQWFRKALELGYRGAHRELGKVLVSEKSPDAEKEFTAALREDPNDAEALYFLGGFLLQENRLEGAFPPLQRARRLNPGFWGPYYYLGKIELQKDRPRDAIPLLEKAAELNPGESAVYYQLGRALSKCGRKEEAGRMMERVRAIKARDMAAH